MNKLMISLMLFAAAAIALTSCEKETFNEGIESNDTFTLSFTAGAPESKTSVAINGDKANFAWSVDGEGNLTDRVVFLQTQDANTDVNNKYNNTDKSSISEGVATFVTDFNAVAGANSYNYAAIYPAQSISGTALTGIGVELPASQTLTEGNYDPAADLMMSKLIKDVKADDGHGGNLEFTRLAAIGKMNLKLSGMETGEKIEKVVITFKEEVMNGDVTLNFTECTATYAKTGSNTVTLNGSIAANADRTAIFFTCFPGKYSGAYSVEVTTDKATYSNTGKSIDEDKALEFKAGDVLGFNLTAGNRTVSNIETYTKVTKTNLADYSGTYLLVYEAGKVAFDGSRATLDAASNNKGVEITNNTITGAYSDYTFTIAKVEGGYSIKSASGKYIGRSATSNGLNATDTYSADYLNTIENLVIKGKGGASLKYNKTSDQNRFRYFASGQEAIALYRLNGSGSDDELVKTLESISVSGQTTTFEVGDTFAFNGTVTAKYNDNSTKTITEGYTVNSSAVKMDTKGTYTVTVSYTEDEVTKEVSYTVTVNEKSQGGAPVYKKVTEAPADWSGKYLIVWGTGAHATVSSKDLAKTVDVTISNNEIVSSATVDAAAVTVAATTSGYSVLLPSGKYLSMNASSNQVAAVTNAYNITFTYTTNGIKISGTDTQGNVRTVAKNGDYYRAYPNVSNYVLPTLYKYTGGSETPEPEQPETPAVVAPTIYVDEQEVPAEGATNATADVDLGSPVGDWTYTVTVTSTDTWLTNMSLSDGKVYYTAAANTGDERTATVTITASCAGQTVTKEFTITQAAAEVVVEPDQPETPTIQTYTETFANYAPSSAATSYNLSGNFAGVSESGITWTYSGCGNPNQTTSDVNSLKSKGLTSSTGITMGKNGQVSATIPGNVTSVSFYVLTSSKATCSVTITNGTSTTTKTVAKSTTNKFEITDIKGNSGSTTITFKEASTQNRVTIAGLTYTK